MFYSNKSAIYSAAEINKVRAAGYGVGVSAPHEVLAGFCNILFLFWNLKRRSPWNLKISLICLPDIFDWNNVSERYY